jgi:transposase
LGTGGAVDLGPYHAQIASVEGHAGREHTDPQLLVSLWLYAYSRGISSAREISRQCEYEPGLQWLCGLAPISHRTLSGFRSECKGALDDLFVQVPGMMSAEGLITLQRVTLDGTKIKANPGGNTFRRKQKLETHLELAREQVRVLNAQAEDRRDGEAASCGATARGAAAGEPLGSGSARSRAPARRKKHDRKQFVARASSTDPDAHVMRNGEGGPVPATTYNCSPTPDTASW